MSTLENNSNTFNNNYRSIMIAPLSSVITKIKFNIKLRRIETVLVISVHKHKFKIFNHFPGMAENSQEVRILHR
jgi:hypothetical protein